MRKLISLMHVSLDGFCAGPKGEMDWIGFNDAIFADATELAHRAGAAIYGRTTYGMMRGHWPSLLDKPDSPEVRHARWVEDIPKFTFSRNLEIDGWNNHQIRRDARDVLDLKGQTGGDLLIFGSPRLVHSFLSLDVIDEFWIFLNPVLLSAGQRYLDDARKTALKLAANRSFDNGVTRLHYVKGE